MFQPTRRRISEKFKSTLNSDALPFHEILNDDMVESALTSEGVRFKDRIYTPFVTLCLLLSQVLDQDHTCRAPFMRLILRQQKVGDRFGRVEPRANKRRPKAQRYMMEPRATARKRLHTAA
jgi:hypothetical protein